MSATAVGIRRLALLSEMGYCHCLGCGRAVDSVENDPRRHHSNEDMDFLCMNTSASLLQEFFSTLDEAFKSRDSICRKRKIIALLKPNQSVCKVTRYSKVIKRKHLKIKECD